MNLYTRLYGSMLQCCDRGGLGTGFAYTVAMLALGLGLSLNLLSVLDLLWTLHVLRNPYLREGMLAPAHYVYGLLYGCLLANVVLARVQFYGTGSAPAPASESGTLGPSYLLGSVALFGITLSLGFLADP